MMNNFINWYPDDYCTNCDSSNSVKLVTTKGKKVVISHYKDTFQYSHFECKNCGKRYLIDWSSKSPRPLRNTDIVVNKFLTDWTMKK